MEEYVDSLVGVNTTALYDEIEKDADFMDSKDSLKHRFVVTESGGANLWGVNNNAKLSLNIDGTDVEHTAKEWFDILQKDKDDDGYGLSKDEAKEVLKALGVHA